MISFQVLLLLLLQLLRRRCHQWRCWEASYRRPTIPVQGTRQQHKEHSYEGWMLL